jgi:hypothetical protein
MPLINIVIPAGMTHLRKGYELPSVNPVIRTAAMWSDSQHLNTRTRLAIKNVIKDSQEPDIAGYEEETRFYTDAALRIHAPLPR